MAKPLNRPFKALRALKKREAATAPKPPKEPETFAEAASADGVKRNVPASRRVSPAKPPSRRVVSVEPEREYAFVVRVDAEMVEGRRDDTEPVAIAWLLRQEPTAKLDLHGHNAHEARRAVHRFVRACCKRGEEVVAIVTGRGRGAKRGGVLKRECPEWLAEEGMHRYVRALVTAPPEHGGQGALLVLLSTLPRPP